MSVYVIHSKTIVLQMCKLMYFAITWLNVGHIVHFRTSYLNYNVIRHCAYPATHSSPFFTNTSTATIFSDIILLIFSLMKLVNKKPDKI